MVVFILYTVMCIVGIVEEIRKHEFKIQVLKF